MAKFSQQCQHALQMVSISLIFHLFGMASVYYPKSFLKFERACVMGAFRPLCILQVALSGFKSIKHELSLTVAIVLGITATWNSVVCRDRIAL